MASTNPVRPSTDAMGMSSTPRFLSSLKTVSQYLDDSVAPSQMHPERPSCRQVLCLLPRRRPSSLPVRPRGRCSVWHQGQPWHRRSEVASPASLIMGRILSVIFDTRLSSTLIPYRLLHGLLDLLVDTP